MVMAPISVMKCLYPIVLIAICSGTNKINTVEFIPLLLSTSSCAVHWSSADENWNNSDLTLT